MPNTEHVTNEDLHARLSVVEAQLDSISANVNTLVALKNKGAGVLWVASILVTGSFTLFVTWIGNFFGGNS